MSSCSVGKTFGLSTQTNALHKFSMLLRLTWLQSFGEEHIVSLNTVKKKLKTKLKIYSSKVQKAKGSKRINMAKWSQANKEVINLLKRGVEPDKFAKPEKDFYFDQVNLI